MLSTLYPTSKVTNNLAQQSHCACVYDSTSNLYCAFMLVEVEINHGAL